MREVPFAAVPGPRGLPRRAGRCSITTSRVLLGSGLYQPDGQILDEVYEYDSFLQSKMHANHVQCTDCHDPHSLKLKFEGNQLCTQCHERTIRRSTIRRPTIITQMGSTGAQCINCHMPTRMYMVIDERRDHSFRVPRPDLSVELGTSNACNNCHTKPDETFAVGGRRDQEMVRRAEAEREPHWAAGDQGGPGCEAGGREAAARFAWRTTRRRRSCGQRRSTCWRIIHRARASRRVATALHDSDPLVRLAAVRVLPGDNPQLLVADLASVLERSAASVRITAATRLAHLPMRQAHR